MEILTTRSVDHFRAGRGFRAPYTEPLSLEQAFTDVYKASGNQTLEVRELALLNVMLPAMLQPIAADDLLAGRIRYPLVGITVEPMSQVGFYCCVEQLQEATADPSLPELLRTRAAGLVRFWSGRTTQDKIREAFSPEMAWAMPGTDLTRDGAVAFPLFRMGGMTLDYEKLLRLGLPGLRAEILQRRDSATTGAARRFLVQCAASLDLIHAGLRTYGTEARQLARSAGEQREAEFCRMAEILEALQLRAPQSFHEAMQLMWIYALCSGTWNYGRMDVYLGPFLARDLEAGRLDEAQALKLIRCLWRLIADYDNMFNNRVYIGGKGRANEAAADRFALLALEATRLEVCNQPQLSLRFYEGQNPELYHKGLDVIGTGRTFPLLYNDDVYIPATRQAFGVSANEATLYVPYGCGENVLGHISSDTPNGLINLGKALEVTLHRGRDPGTGNAIGLDMGDPAAFATFEDLWHAVMSQIEFFVRCLAAHQKLEYDVTAAALNFPLVSVLTGDCLERGRPAFNGGVRYLGGTLESYGNTNLADSLTAIKQVVYEQQRATLPEVVAACVADFEGYEELHAWLRAAPKYGNDDPIADDMAGRVHEHCCRYTAAQAAPHGLHHYLIVIINNSANVDLGRNTGATPDGRRAGDALANANNPFPGMDRQGTTAFLNSLVKLDPHIHAGAVQNMKFAPVLFTRHRAQLEALLAVYFKQGGTQAMITVVSRNDLESALREPEKWGHLMVRVGGYSARFIDLPPDVQHEILRRTLNE